MLELICQHAYTWDGVPADRSPYRNHGTAFNTGGAFDGAEPGSGVITFPQPGSRVRIPTGPSWKSLVALKIEVIARIDVANARKPTLIAGDGSFSFSLLEGGLTAEFDTGAGLIDVVRSADMYAPDGRFHAVPVGRWVKLGVHHDGFARARLFIDDVLVGETLVRGGVLPVKNGGVAIGNAIHVNGLQFPGLIDEVSIWRLDPQQLKREFLGRPYTREIAECWERHAEAVSTWLREHPDQARAILQACQNLGRPAIRTARLLPDSEQAKLRAILAELTDLWFSGQITGSEMQDVLRRWVAALRAAGIDPSGGADGQRLTELVARSGFKGPDILECDRQIAAFLRHMQRALDADGKTSEVAS